MSLSKFHEKKDDKEGGKEIETRKVENGEHDHDYNLRGVVCHIGGTASSGHYTANCERMKKNKIKTKESSEESSPGPTNSEIRKTNKEWVAFDDGTSERITIPDVLESQRSRRTAYMLLYAL